MSETSSEKPTLLLVDDQKSVLTALSHVFAYAGFKVLPAGSAVSAIELAETEKFDGALFDVHMPQMTGIELCDRLKRAGVVDNRPLWLMTGAPTATIHRHAVGLGIANVFPKPFDFSAVIREITAGLSCANKQ